MSDLSFGRRLGLKKKRTPAETGEDDSHRWSPPPSRGLLRAIGTASLNPASFTIRLAVVRIPSRCARSTALFILEDRPKSSALTIRRRKGTAWLEAAMGRFCKCRAGELLV